MFGRGKIDISIKKTSYAPGDTISGSVDLTLNKAVRAREMTLSLIGEYMTVQTRHLVRVAGSGDMRAAMDWGRMDRRMLMSDAVRKSAPKSDFRTDTKTVRLCPFEEKLDGEGEYPQSRSYHFDIKIPREIPTSPIVKWHLLANLDIYHGSDLSKKVRLKIG
jgi:hypothetical protein